MACLSDGAEAVSGRETRATQTSLCLQARVVLGLILGLAVAAAAPGSRADIYRYIDQQGVVHFSNVPTTVRYRLYLPETKLDVRAYYYRFDRIIKEVASREGIDLSLIKALIKAESDFNKKAVSAAGARGLMQLMPKTARELAVKNPFDPEENIQAGVRHLKALLQRFNNDVPLALAAYNAGENAVRKYGRIPPFEQTRAFVDRVLRYWDEFKLHPKSVP